MNLPETYFWVINLICFGTFQGAIADLVISIKYPAIMNFRLGSGQEISKYVRWHRFAYDGIGAWIFKVIVLSSSVACIVFNLIDLNPVIPLIVLLLSHLLIYPRWRNFVASDSPLLRAVLFSAILYFGFEENLRIAYASLLFLAIYVCLIYLISGIQKIKSAEWRNGEAMVKFKEKFDLLGRSNHAHKRRWLMVSTAWVVVVFEMSFLLGLALPELTMTYLIAGLIFHGSLSLFAGINHFLWTFLSCYPALLYVSIHLNEITDLLFK